MCHRDSLFTELQTSHHRNSEVTQQRIASSIVGSFVNQKSKKYKSLNLFDVIWGLSDSCNPSLLKLSCNLKKGFAIVPLHSDVDTFPRKKRVSDNLPVWGIVDYSLCWHLHKKLGGVGCNQVKAMVWCRRRKGFVIRVQCCFLIVQVRSRCRPATAYNLL